MIEATAQLTQDLPYVDVTSMLRDLSDAGIEAGDLLVVHSSLSRIGRVIGGANAVIRALIKTVSEEGGLLFPSLTFSGSVTEFLRNRRVVDLRSSPSMTGIIPKTAQAWPGAVRSVHPTHPVIAIGRRALACIRGIQSGQGPCGIDSPFYHAAQDGGKIILIGVTNASNTTLHCIEELAAPYIFNGERFTVDTIDLYGRHRQIQVRGYTTQTPRAFESIEPRLLNAGIMSVHRFGATEARVINSQRLINDLREWLLADNRLLILR